ncbi:MAG: dihydroxyacetone kinase subunit DhaK [Syntrophales bacterium]
MKMKKFINDPKNLTKEVLEGLELANPSRLYIGENKLVVSKYLGDKKRVHIVTLGGTGHEPALSGYVGKGMVDISVPGDIFAAPGPPACLKALEMAYTASAGAGVLFVVLNHAGDMMTGNMTMEMAKEKKINVLKLVTQEDISNASRENRNDRRGLVGCVPLYKIAAAASVEGKNLQEVYAIAQRFNENMGTLAVALRGATHPQTGDMISVLGEDEMEIGMGQHGEGGGGRMKVKTADETTDIMADALIKELNIKRGDNVMIIVNGSGSTTHMELLIIFRRAYRKLESMGVKTVASWVDEILTVQEAAGFQLFFARMDDELLRYWNAPCDTPYLRVGR